MSWKDRLKGIIELTSPQGNTFEAFWRGNSITFEKKLGIFNFPGVAGAKVQDLDVTANLYPLNLFFEGRDQDLESERFASALKERGTWVIIHPTKGKKSLQLVSVDEKVEPVESGNITEFVTQWIEPLNDQIIVSTAQLAAAIISQTDNSNISSGDQLSTNIFQNSFKETSAIEIAINSVVNAVTNNLAVLYEPIAEINARVTSIIRGIQDTISATVIDVAGLAGQIQNLIQLPLLATNDIESRLANYTGLINDIIANITVDTADQANKNTISVKEIAQVSALVAVAQISATGLLATRNQAIDTSDEVRNLFTSVTNDLDSAQELFKNSDIDVQYFSESQSFSDTYLIISQAVAYLLQASFDLAIERTFVLETPRAPIEITITEYGGLGESDSNYDLFIESNNLKGQEIIILPAGREVVVYV